MQSKIPVVIDCDPGIDDAHALLVAMASDKLDVRAITTVAGNMPLTVTTENALRIVELAGKSIPVYAGCSEPVVRSSIQHSELFHGKNGLGNVEMPPPGGKPGAPHAVEALRQEIERAKGALHIIALAPLTNIAMLFKMYPECKGQISHITIMGGAQSGGNITQYAEFNWYCDGEAAAVVMGAGVPVTLVDLDGCDNARIYRADSERILALGGRLVPLLQGMWDFNFALAERFGDDWFVIHDSITVASVACPALLETSPCQVSVTLTDEERYGQSNVKQVGESPTRITTKTDRALFLHICEDTMRAYR